ncbi:succinate dehydrogenase cytochrome b subunit [Phaeodactylibacter luteus]|uniref:Succinate dehydrogenase cytochrome b subunit n=1 Tax=Phaeodactylibacter luteus TaxID=1564516 RepID=A0A5C6RQ77_9BACT|nr:succinate dehydrogenase cytochrome b subunit [Phaeodactylibacter luteus]TXB64159.1 succinate dehydrogenase cytochrome b subunit [Phaeodactylibacter luteus]
MHLPFRHSIARKNLMALTGGFLSFFLLIHLAGNLQLLLPEARAREQFNLYAQLLSGNILIKAISYGLYLSILLHALYALLLALSSRKARGGQAYVYDHRRQASPWYARSMGLLGSILLVFLAVHMKDFWYVYKFTAIPLDEHGQKDLYTVVATAYQEAWYVLLYVVAMIALGFHLLHGVKSALFSLGLYHPRYRLWAKRASTAYAIAMTAGFCLIPIYLYFTQNPA